MLVLHDPFATISFLKGSALVIGDVQDARTLRLLRRVVSPHASAEHVRGAVSFRIMRRLRAFNAVKVFSATTPMQRALLGERVMQWLATHRDIELVDVDVRQSSDRQFHCLTIIAFYNAA